jgi:hypothetical protein
MPSGSGCATSPGDGFAVPVSMNSWAQARLVPESPAPPRLATWLRPGDCRCLVLVDHMAMPMMMVMPVMMAVMGIGLYDDSLSLGGEWQPESEQEHEDGQNAHDGSPWNSLMDARTISGPANSTTPIVKIRADTGKILNLPEPAAGSCTRAGSVAAVGVGAWADPRGSENKSRILVLYVFRKSFFDRFFLARILSNRLGNPTPWSRPPGHQTPVFGIDAQGSIGGSASPSCSSSIEILSGERMKAMRPSRGGRLIVTPLSRSDWQNP